MEVAVLLVPVERLLVAVLVPERVVVLAMAEGLGLDSVAVLDVVHRLGRLDGRVLGVSKRLRLFLLDLLWGCVCMYLYWWHEFISILHPSFTKSPPSEPPQSPHLLNLGLLDLALERRLPHCVHGRLLRLVRLRRHLLDRVLVLVASRLLVPVDGRLLGLVAVQVLLVPLRLLLEARLLLVDLVVAVLVRLPLDEWIEVDGHRGQRSPPEYVIHAPAYIHARLP